ncbi:DUF2306 domain-containing protein [Jannaschia sp. M317]|uniref:DUF2306 domain-containing protein n=1 Tax=Jannaschia sp. M317 TaxID=2867011 RepID=UPI0021A8D60A|nr:DUF2306 domain-containing protein [Jannaschia sp. M317]UWQ16461.1 DUF2306 domain-containing protein [Jannaschia sp. M317]
MTLDPFLTAPVHIQIHAGAALLALVLGPVALFSRRRGAMHRGAGWVWVLAMVVTALSSFLIHGFGVIGPLSPIHILALFALWSVWRAMRQVMAGRIRDHALTMRGLYWRGLCLAGLFNFLPGRATNRALLPDDPQVGWIVILVGCAAIAGHALLTARREGRSAIFGGKRREGQKPSFLSARPSLFPRHADDRAVVAELVDAQR